MDQENAKKATGWLEIIFVEQCGNVGMVVTFRAILDLSLYTLHQCRRPAVLMDFQELVRVTVLNKAVIHSRPCITWLRVLLALARSGVIVNENNRYLMFNAHMCYVKQDFGSMTLYNGGGYQAQCDWQKGPIELSWLWKKPLRFTLDSLTILLCFMIPCHVKILWLF